jgi:hypothetical protein
MLPGYPPRVRIFAKNCAADVQAASRSVIDVQSPGNHRPFLAILAARNRFAQVDLPGLIGGSRRDPDVPATGGQPTPPFAYTDGELISYGDEHLVSLTQFDVGLNWW